jgi:hypothetical protein
MRYAPVGAFVDAWQVRMSEDAAEHFVAAVCHCSFAHLLNR